MPNTTPERSDKLLALLLADAGVELSQLADGWRRLAEVDRPRMARQWAYYRNPMLSPGRSHGTGTERPYRQAQEWGMPGRITGFLTGQVEPTAVPLEGIARKEVVVENDIGWRVDAMIDHLFGRELSIESTAPDPQRAVLLGAVVRAVFERHGGLRFLQQLSLFGMVYGFVDVAVKLEANGTRGTGASADVEGRAADEDISNDGRGRGDSPDGRLIERLARQIRLEIVHPSHALPLPVGVEQPRAYLRAWGSTPPPDRHNAERRWWQRWKPELPRTGIAVLPTDFELLTDRGFLLSRGGAVVASGQHHLGRLPVVHIQNLAVPFEYAGRSDVEPLIPLQDELNTRLSDRAHRITMQSFRMFLAKGIDNFLSLPVSPGRMWSTDNEDADIQEFGGDAKCPSEEQHIAEVREAMDKASGVPPVAAGLIRDRVGQLSSAAALRVTLQALLAKTDRKRATYGRGLADIAELCLRWLHVAGELTTDDDERGIRITWPSPLPENGLERLREAEMKVKLGVSPEIVRRELGY